LVIKQRISDNLIKSLPTTTTRVNDSEISGFHLRVGRADNAGSRTISYYFYYRHGGRNGRQINFLIGRSNVISAGEARRIAKQIQPLILAGKDVKKMQQEAQTDTLQLKHFWRYNGRQFFIRKYKKYQDAIRHIETIVLPVLGSVALTKISHRLVELRLVKPLVAQNKLSTLRIVISQLKTLLSHAIEHEIIVSQPIRSFELMAAAPVKELSVTCQLSGAQLKGLYYRATKEPKPIASLYCLRLQILTGQSLVTICRTYRQDITGNKWSLRSNNGKLSGREIPLIGPLKQLVKDILKLFPKTRSLYLFPGRLRKEPGQMKGNDWSMDTRALAKQQQQFVFNIHNVNLTQTVLAKMIEQAMFALKLNPLVVAYLFDRKLAPSLTLDPRDPVIAETLALWHQA